MIVGLQVLLGLALLLGQSLWSLITPSHLLIPNLILPIVVYLGVTQDVPIVRGATTSFLLGYLFDLFSGNPMGLGTFVIVATFMLSRLAGLRLFMRGLLFQVLLAFAVSLAFGAATLAIQAIFGRPLPGPEASAWSAVLVSTVPAVITAVASPLVFAALRRIDAYAAGGARRDDSRGVAS